MQAVFHLSLLITMMVIFFHGAIYSFIFIKILPMWFDESCQEKKREKPPSFSFVPIDHSCGFSLLRDYYPFYGKR